MIKIAICEDDKHALLELIKIVDEFIATHMSEYSISYLAFQNGADLLAATEKGQYFDILLLDIIMPLVNGIQLADEIRITNSVSKIIFLTSSPEYAIDSYRVGAYYYLLKPIKKDALFPLLEKASDDILNNLNKHIIVKHGTSLTKIYFNKLQYAEVVGHTIYFYLKSGELVKHLGTMLQLETELLCDKRFIKPHRSYVVNMDFIESLSPKGISIMKDVNIPISRNMYKEIKQLYIDYSFDVGEK